MDLKSGHSGKMVKSRQQTIAVETTFASITPLAHSNTMSTKNFPKLFFSILVCELVGIIGSLFTFSSINTWYSILNKPYFSPPNWLFGPVWTLLYLLMGISLYLIWIQRPNQLTRSAISYFIFQLCLNFLWSPVFFGLQSPVGALLVIVAMWFMILQTIKRFYHLSKPAAYLLYPYLLWVSFATILNTAIVILN